MLSFEVNDLTGDAGDQQGSVTRDEHRVLHENAVDEIKQRSRHLPDEKPFRNALDGGRVRLSPDLSPDRPEQYQGGEPAKRLRAHKVGGDVHDVSESGETAVAAAMCAIHHGDAAAMQTNGRAAGCLRHGGQVPVICPEDGRTVEMGDGSLPLATVGTG